MGICSSLPQEMMAQTMMLGQVFHVLRHMTILYASLQVGKRKTIWHILAITVKKLLMSQLPGTIS
jgi:hypothetical protein